MNNMSRTVITLLFLTTTVSVKAQIAAAEPEYDNTIVFVDKANKTTSLLERQTPENKISTSASSYILGVGKTKSIDFVKGMKSAVRITKSDTIRFVARVKDNNDNPADVIKIVRFKVNTKKDIRYVDNVSVGTLSTPQQAEVERIDFTAGKYGTQSYMITVVDLVPGEYYITLKDAQATLQAFDID